MEAPPLADARALDRSGRELGRSDDTGILWLEAPTWPTGLTIEREGFEPFRWPDDCPARRSSPRGAERVELSRR